VRDYAHLFFKNENYVGISMTSMRTGIAGLFESYYFGCSRGYLVSFPLAQCSTTFGPPHVHSFHFTLDDLSKVMIIGIKPCEIVTKRETILNALLQSHFGNIYDKCQSGVWQISVKTAGWLKSCKSFLDFKNVRE
jgi:hypothetical protein